MGSRWSLILMPLDRAAVEAEQTRKLTALLDEIFGRNAFYDGKSRQAGTACPTRTSRSLTSTNWWKISARIRLSDRT